jgi:hypothetical protein
MEAVTITGNDGTLIINGIVQLQPFHAARGAAVIC